MEHPVDCAAKAVGSQAALAVQLGVTRSAVNQWKLTGRGVPIEHCASIERVTGGKVRRWDLRPSDWPAIWPELIDHPDAPAIAEPEPKAA